METSNPQFIYLVLYRQTQNSQNLVLLSLHAKKDKHEMAGIDGFYGFFRKLLC